MFLLIIYLPKEKAIAFERVHKIKLAGRMQVYHKSGFSPDQPSAIRISGFKARATAFQLGADTDAAEFVIKKYNNQHPMDVIAQQPRISQDELDLLIACIASYEDEQDRTEALEILERMRFREMDKCY